MLAIVLAPTDAALGQAVVTDPRVPSRVRQGLNVESGLNDGICVPLLLIAIAIAEATEGAIGDGAAVHLVLEEIGYGCLGGVVAGLAAAIVVRLGVQRRLVDSIWLQVVPVAGATLAYGLAVWMGGSGFIAAFVGGAVFGGLRREVGGEVTLFLEEAGGVLGAVTFLLFGAVMLVPMLDDLSAEVFLYAVLSLTVVRMVPVALAFLGTGARRPTVAFVGWFGPRGVGVDRVRGDPGRGCRPRARVVAAEHDLCHGRPLCAPAPPERNAARAALRRLVRPTLATRRPRSRRCRLLSSLLTDGRPGCGRSTDGGRTRRAGARLATTPRRLDCRWTRSPPGRDRHPPDPGSGRCQLDRRDQQLIIAELNAEKSEIQSPVDQHPDTSGRPTESGLRCGAAVAPGCASFSLPR